MLASTHFGLCCESVGSMMLRGVFLCDVCCVGDVVYCSENIVAFTGRIPMELEWFCRTSVSLQVA